MNYSRACILLDLPENFNFKQLKLKYYSAALKYHPDKNSNNTANSDFQNINEAYNYLSQFNNDNIENNDIEISYTSLLSKFLSGTLNMEDPEYIINLITSQCTKISFDILNKLSKSTILSLNKIITDHGNILNINKDIVNHIANLVTNFTQNDTIITIKPNLTNLLNNELYKLEFNKEIYYIPFWHHELIYDLSGSQLIVKCEPKLPDYISIDNLNNLYINIALQLSEIYIKETIDISIGENKFILYVKDLKIVKFQQIILKAKGIAQINSSDIFCISKKASIYVAIHFSDIP
tara:strand:- start:1741 stop:2619 length:879 start_codon:yes stop_codon:yes gene_type:complete